VPTAKHCSNYCHLVEHVVPPTPRFGISKHSFQVSAHGKQPVWKQVRSKLFLQ